MSLINCENSTSRGNFVRALRAVGGWIDSHESASAGLVDPQQISRELSQFSDSDISEAIVCLAAEGDITPVFGVKTPSGVLAEQLFGSPEQVPDLLEDRFYSKFETAGSEIVPLFQVVKNR